MKRSQKEIAVICSTGHGTALIIQRQLEKFWVQTSRLPIFRQREERINICYFTTIPLKNIRPQTPMIHLTNLFNDTWLRNEWQRAKEIRSVESQNIHMTYQLLENTVTERISKIWAEKLADPQFIERIFTREDQQTTILNRGLPFPIQLIKPYQRLFYRLGF